MAQELEYDVAVIGGSYAGMSAALQVARARRRIVVIDTGLRRNRFTSHSHGFLTHDGSRPEEVFNRARTQLLDYPGVTWRARRAERAHKVDPDAFGVELDDGALVSARRLILAFGVTDTLPEVPGLDERWGKSVFHCPYCHGYELDGGPIGVLATSPASLHQAMLLPDWGPTTFFVNGAFELSPADEAELANRGVALEKESVEGAVGTADLRMADGRVIALAGLFVASRTAPASSLAEELGCAIERSPFGQFIATDEMKKTTVPGVFACGDAARMAGSVSLAVGDGALAGAVAHQSLIFS